MSGTSMIAFYSSVSLEDVVGLATRVCDDVGFQVRNSSEPEFESPDEKSLVLDIPYNGWAITLRFNLDEKREPNEPVLTLGELSTIFNTSDKNRGESPSQRADVLFELTCRLATALEAEYVPLIDMGGRANSVIPRGRPIGDTVEAVPRFGVFAASVIDQFGGLEKMYGDPWYTAKLDSGQTVVIESGSPWTDDAWEPPTDASFIEDAESRTASFPSGPSGVSDPFAGLDMGEFGTEVGVHPDDIAEEFVNDDLELVRVYVDDDRNLRRVDTDAFVRNVVDDAASDVETVKEMLGDVPRDASDAEKRVSALLHEAIPSSFVRLDGPDDENVVTRVMNLDVETNKYDLLLSLGATASGDGFTDDDLETMEQALETLSSMENVDGVEQLIEERLL